ncbi:transcription initiation factor TFIID, 31kD subunit [Cordyceps militaris CM01]|uniref:Transcription initiation factor TFIID, 31kD subunit n=2 Tax=Cordyceps militaris TaxID=73501 RepID=G3JJM6_CORMM|nr:transcription initiation factor TFIID, 31kD subunit [Cordyceps militaris CM01]ATY58958.1 transcription initiation factor 31kD subunit [Cordyceps militaris]EGX91266.1 transcription initiation factor TFIID, 31kD subunit [Cordyceps militaris CM01]
MSAAPPQTNGITASAPTAPAAINHAQGAAPTGGPSSTSQPTGAAAPRPRDARLVELLLTSQGVTAYEQRVPLLLLDFAYRHTSSILNDALHLAGDPYVSQAGAKPSASAGASAAAPGDAAVSANAIKLSVAARLGYQFRGGSSGGGISKEYMQELARERNKVALPRIVAHEWGVRLPSERFVLSGTSWGLQDVWDEIGDDEVPEATGDAMEGIQGPAPEDIGGDGVEGGTVEDMFGDDVDEEMAE